MIAGNIISILVIGLYIMLTVFIVKNEAPAETLTTKTATSETQALTTQITAQPKAEAIPKSWKTYSTPEYEFQYPANYTIQKPLENFPSLILSGPQGKLLELFKPADFEERPLGLTGEDTQAGIDGYVPKETRKVASEEIMPGPAHSSAYEIWLFWPKGNETIKAEVQKIANTIRIK